MVILKSPLAEYIYDFSQVQGGDILFVRPRGIIPYLIEKRISSVWTHTALFINNATLIEAGFKGVRRVPIAKYDGCLMRVKRVRELSDVQRELVVQWAISQEGKGYDFLGMIALAVMLALGRNVFDVSDRYWCSELVWEAFYQICGIKLCDDNVRFSIATPAMLERSLYLEPVPIVKSRKEVRGL